MRDRSPCQGLHRRHFLAGTAAAAASLSTLAATPASARYSGPARRQREAAEGGLGIPGPYPGQVIEARNPAMFRDGQKDRDAIRATLGRALTELTGADDAVEAWRTFVEPGDAVGIKVVPNGHPLHPTSPELILEVIDGLVAAGVALKDIVVFDRYEGEFLAAGYQEILPDGVTFGGLTPRGPHSQLDVNFDGNDPVAGYDPDEFVEMGLVSRAFDPKDDRSYRSHLGLLVTKRLNKIICLPCLKDHGSAGVTGALKNMSHGLINNVERSHSTAYTNACNTFIPAVVNHPIIRQKCVLQIMDGIRGVWQGGPFAAGRSGSGTTTPCSSPPTRSRSTTSSGTSSTRSGRPRASPASAPSASSAPTPSPAPPAPRGSTSGSPSTSPWPATSASASSTTARPRAAGTRSTTGSSTSPDAGPALHRSAPGLARGHGATGGLPAGGINAARSTGGQAASGTRKNALQQCHPSVEAPRTELWLP